MIGLLRSGEAYAISQHKEEQTMIEDIGAWIKKARTDAGLTQTALAGMLDGITAADISKAERGLTQLLPQQLEAITAAIGIAPEAPAFPQEETAQAPDPQAAAQAMDTAELLALYRKADPEIRNAVVALLKGEKDFMPLLTVLFNSLMKNLTLSGGPIAGIINNVMGLFDPKSNGAEPPLVTILNGVTGIVSGVMSMKAASAKEKAEKAAGSPAETGERPEPADTGAKVPPAAAGKAISGPLLGFTFSYAVVIYLLLLSFYFWLWRTDITPQQDANK